MLLAQISDFHITTDGRLAYGVVDTAAMLRQCVQHIAALRPKVDAVLATGDLVDLGSAEEYALLRDILAGLSVPVYLLPGNHDRREAMRHGFADLAYLPAVGPLDYAVELGPIRLIVLDSLVEGAAGGRLGPAQLNWLERELDAAGHTPVIVALHHPPMVTGIDHMDCMALDLEADARLGAIVERHPRVERILCGHLHRPIQARYHGSLLMTAPSSAHQIVLDLAPDAAAAFIMEPPGFLLHHWNGSVLISHYQPVGKFSPAYLFE